jgi:hypothetical protein
MQQTSAGIFLPTAGFGENEGKAQAAFSKDALSQ